MAPVRLDQAIRSPAIVANDAGVVTPLAEFWTFLQRHIDFGMAWKGALFLGLVVFGINYMEHGAIAALPAALKQATYTYFVAGFVTRLAENLAAKLEPAVLALSLAVLVPSTIAIGLTFGLHSLRGTPEPLLSTIPTLVSAPPAFFRLGIQEETRSPEGQHSMSSPEGQHIDMSRTDMGHLTRIVSSWGARFMTSDRRKALLDGTRERIRRLRGEPHRVVYYHEVADPYSHLAAQALLPIIERYEIEIECRVSDTEGGANRPEPEMLARWARTDCAAVAPHYELAFPTDASAPDPDLVARAQRLLVAAEASGAPAFSLRAVEVGEAVWNGDAEAMAKLESQSHAATDSETHARIADAATQRARMGHYSGAMFHYAGEWFWGVDRLHHLERRLTGLGAARTDEGFCFGRPPLETDPVPRADALTLEIFPSLRSPYSAIGYEPALDLAKATGIRTVTRPVLPMVMRGVPVSMAKGLYIFSDTKREAASLGMPFGKMLDPIGGPVKRAFSLWPWAKTQGKGEALLASFLRGAFSEAIDTSNDAGLRKIVERAGLDWAEAAPHLGSTDWEKELEDNRLCMLEEMGQWGVPSFRLHGPAGEPDFIVWGQDRLWLVSREIQRRGAAAQKKDGTTA